MSEITSAIKQICEEKGLTYEAVIGTIESALAAAYRKDYGEKNQNIRVDFDPETMETKVYDLKVVVEDMPEEEPAPDDAEQSDDSEEKEKQESDTDGKDKSDSASPEASQNKEDGVLKKNAENEEKEHAASVEAVRRFNPRTEIQLSDAKEIKPDAEVGDEIRTDLETKEEYGRMAAQTAKQVIIQRLREAERDMVFDEFKDKEHEVISGVVQRREGRVILVDVGKSVGLILPEDQIRTEKYLPGTRMKVFVREVRQGAKGPEIILSRTAEEILKKVFYLEIPEISNNLIEIMGVAREAGSRSKVAVQALSDNIDPIGSCVGQRGSRIQTIIQELGGEKIDIIEYNEDPSDYIANALAPAKIEEVELDEEERKAIVKVPEDQLSLAIGKSGQNVRLAARLTGWKIDIMNLDAGGEIEATSESDKQDDESENEDKGEKKDDEKNDSEKEAQAGEDNEKDKQDKSDDAEPEEPASAKNDGESEEDSDEDAEKEDEKKDKKDKK